MIASSSVHRPPVPPVFEATFECKRTQHGTTEVTHREVFVLRRPWRWLANPVLRHWLEADTRAEMTRFRELVDATGEAKSHTPA